MGLILETTFPAVPAFKPFEMRRRRERKYLIGSDEVRILSQALADFTESDAHAGPDGTYRVTSLYFDNPEHEAYWARVDGRRARRKLRLRGYAPRSDEPFERVLVEIKRREGPFVTKDRIRLPLASAESLCRGEGIPDGLEGGDIETAERVLALVRAWNLRPVCRISYRRRAFGVAHHASGMRVTFDTDVRGRVTALGLAERGTDRRILPPEAVLMEVKTRAGTPDWWEALLRQIGVRARPFSKYNAALRGGLARMRTQFDQQEDLHG